MRQSESDFYHLVIEGEGLAIKDVDDDGKCIMHIPGRSGLAVYDHWSLLKTPAARMHFVRGVLAGIKVGALFGDPVPGAPEITRLYVRDESDKLNPDHAELCIHFKGIADYARVTLPALQQAAWAALFVKNASIALSPKRGVADG